MRSSRTLALALTTALAVIIVVSLVVVTRSDGSVKQQPAIRTIEKKQQQVSSKQQKRLSRLSRTIANQQTTTWRCQDTLRIRRSKPSTGVWALPPSIQYRTWVAELWKGKASTCVARLSLLTIPPTNDWLTSVRLVQRIYPGTSDWLLYISRREGGHGGFVMNHQGSGAGGWMQFMASTYYAYNNAAFADTRQRGFIVDESLNRWESAFGQALTAGYMRFTGRDGCHWCL